MSYSSYSTYRNHQYLSPSRYAVEGTNYRAQASLPRSAATPGCECILHFKAIGEGGGFELNPALFSSGFYQK